MCDGDGSGGKCAGEMKSLQTAAVPVCWDGAQGAQQVPVSMIPVIPLIPLPKEQWDRPFTSPMLLLQVAGCCSALP